LPFSNLPPATTKTVGRGRDDTLFSLSCDIGQQAVFPLSFAIGYSG
jgi:hypothetical protein